MKIEHNTPLSFIILNEELFSNLTVIAPGLEKLAHRNKMIEEIEDLRFGPGVYIKALPDNDTRAAMLKDAQELWEEGQNSMYGRPPLLRKVFIPESLFLFIRNLLECRHENTEKNFGYIVEGHYDEWRGRRVLVAKHILRPLGKDEYHNAMAIQDLQDWVKQSIRDDVQAARKE